MKRKLKTRILKNIILALVVTSVITTIVAYLYFNKVVKEQVINNERVKLSQMIHQLTFMVIDIENFSKSIVIDPSIQEIITDISFDNEFQKVKKNHEVANKLVFYKSLRNYIGVVVLTGVNGNNYGSISYADELYYKQKFDLPELKNYIEDESLIFSDPYEAFEYDVSGCVVSYRTVIRQLSDIDQIAGELYVDIYLDYFLSEIESYANDYENVFLIGNNGKLIYIKDDQLDIPDFEQVHNIDSRGSIIRTSSGYVLVQPITNMNWTLATYVSDEYIWRKSNFVLNFFIVFFIMSIVLSVVLIARIIDNMVRPISKLTQAMDTIQYETMEVDLNIDTGDEIELMADRFKEMLQEINGYMKQVMENEKKQKEMSFDILLSQINPHYLYNVLNTVVYLSAANKNGEVIEVVKAMIYTLQETLKVGEKHIFTTLEQELKLLTSYLTIQKYRYPNWFEVRVQCDESLYPAIVPKTILQPIVENGLFHGIIPSEESGIIYVSIDEEDDVMKIIVENTGIPVDIVKANNILYGHQMEKEEHNRKKHIGIKNINDRIQHLYGEDYGLTIESRSSGGAKVTITFPNT